VPGEPSGSGGGKGDFILALEYSRCERWKMPRNNPLVVFYRIDPDFGQSLGARACRGTHHRCLDNFGEDS